MKDRDAAEWEEIARREPYFAILTNEGGRGVESNALATAAFFETGEADIASLLPAIASILGRDPPLTSSLDFGCGAGRLTLPLARRAERVVACDIAPTMLAHARENAQRAGLHNITFLETGALKELQDHQFDFVCSLLVLEHIPPATGYAIIRTLLRLLAPGGIAALHGPFVRRSGGLRSFARTIRGGSRRAIRPGVTPDNTARTGALNEEYDERVVRRDIETSGARLIGRLPTRQSDTTGAVLVIQNPSAPASGRSTSRSKRSTVPSLS